MGRATEILRERLNQLGVATWVCDGAGRVTHEPTTGGVANVWLRSPEMGTMISNCVRRLGDTRQSALLEFQPSLWIACVPLMQRSRVSEWLVGLLPSLDGLDTQEFAATCGTARIDAFVVRKAMLSAGAFDERSARTLVMSLDWMARDIVEATQANESINGFTKELANSYETISLLYGLGRSMNDLSQPDAFVQLLVNRIRESLTFGWVLAFVTPNNSALEGSNQRVFCAGDAPISAGEIEDVLADLMSALGSGLMPGVHDQVKQFKGKSQVILQPITRGNQLIGVIVAGDKGGEDPHVSSYDLRLIETAAVYTSAFLENANLYASQQSLFMGTIEALAAAIDAKDAYTCGHSRRVAYLGEMLARAAGATPEQAERVRISGLVHDVGKIGVPEVVLCKAGRLTDDEFELIKQHPVIGHKILRDIPQLVDVLPGVLYHHERYDGKGYPDGLSGEQIPWVARVLGICDTFDAMSSTRAYRPAMPRDKTLAEIQRCAGAQFDPQLATLFLTLDLNEYDRMVAMDAVRVAPSVSPEAGAPILHKAA
jgi:HD-GYP domain-containing protein (c-di-GMP phosphodiesterase class II)